MRLIDADKLTPINAPIAGITTGELTHYEKIVFWKTIYDAPTVNVIDRVLEITNYDPTISMPMSKYAEAIVSVRDETIDSVMEIIDEIDDDQDIKFGIVTYGDGKDELRRRVLELKEGEQE